jgi:pimeloyl-ACP methyl ester carboxylesterase
MAQARDDEGDGGTLFPRQAVAVLRALGRPGTYIGAACEAIVTMVHTVSYAAGAPSVEWLQSGLRAERALDHIQPRLDPRVASMPVVLVHGYVNNSSGFLAMGQALKKAGFRHVHPFDYPQFTHGVDEVSGLLAGEVERVVAAAGVERCMLVGHSMGGMVARYYVQMLGGEDNVDTVITLASPHQGTYGARWGIGPAAAQMVCGSSLLRTLEATARPSDVRYISYYSDLDGWVVPAASAKLLHPTLQAVNIRVRDIGHLSMLLSDTVIRSVVEYLSDPSIGRPCWHSELTALPQPERLLEPPIPAPMPAPPAVRGALGNGTRG